jgi:hypothetical protein
MVLNTTQDEERAEAAREHFYTTAAKPVRADTGIEQAAADWTKALMIITLRCHTVLKALAHHPAGATAETLLADLGDESTESAGRNSAKAGILRTLMAMEEKGLARWEAGQPTGRFHITAAGREQVAKPYCMPGYRRTNHARAGAS